MKDFPITISITAGDSIRLMEYKCSFSTLPHDMERILRMSHQESHLLHDVVSQPKQYEGLVDYAISVGKSYIDKPDTNGNIPLHLAYESNNFIKKLLLAGADPTICNAEGQTILHLYCSRKDANVTREIITLIVKSAIKKLEENKENDYNTPGNTVVKNMNFLGDSIYSLYVDEIYPNLQEDEKKKIVLKTAEFIYRKDRQEKTAYYYASQNKKSYILYLLGKYNLLNRPAG